MSATGHAPIDKSAGFDPAAAPPGTDEEAAGTRPSRDEAAPAGRSERADAPNPNAVQPDMAPDARPKPRGSIGWGLLAGAAAAVVFAALMWLAVA